MGKYNLHGWSVTGYAKGTLSRIITDFILFLNMQLKSPRVTNIFARHAQIMFRNQAM